MLTSPSERGFVDFVPGCGAAEKRFHYGTINQIEVFRCPSCWWFRNTHLSEVIQDISTLWFPTRLPVTESAFRYLGSLVKMAEDIVMVARGMMDGYLCSRERNPDSSEACDGRVKRIPLEES